MDKSLGELQELVLEQHDLFSAEAKREPVFAPERLELLVVRKVGSGISYMSFQP